MSQRGSDTEESDESQRPALFTDYGKRTHQAATCNNYRPDASSGTGLSSIESSDEEDKPSCDITERMTTPKHRSAASILAKIETSSTMSRREDTDEESDENDRPPTNFTDYGKRTHQSAIGNNYRSDDYLESDTGSSTHTTADRDNQAVDIDNAVAGITPASIEDENSANSVGGRDNSNTEGQPNYLKEATLRKMVWKVIIVILSLYSIGSDYWAIIASWFYNFDRPSILIPEIVFLSLSCIINFIFSVRWYHIERKEQLKRQQLVGEANPDCQNCANRHESRQCTVACVFRHLAGLLNLAHLPRKIDAVRYRILHKKAANTCSCKKLYYCKAKELKGDSKMFGMFDIVIEGVPTFIIQASIVLLDGHFRKEQIHSMISSAIMMPYCIVQYNMSGEAYDDIPSKAKIWCKITHLLWRFFEILPRLIAFAALAVAIGGWWLGLGIATNTVILITCVLCIQSQSKEDEATVDSNPKMVKLYLVILAVALNFFYVNTQLAGNTRKSKLWYYFVVEVENALIVLAWILTQDMNNHWTLPIAILIIGSVVPMILFMLVFYKLCHPKHDEIPVCLPKSYWFSCCYPNRSENLVGSSSEMVNLETNQGREDIEA